MILIVDICYIGGGTGFVPKTHIFDWPEGTRIWRKYAKLRMQLLPYIYTQAHVAHEVTIGLFEYLKMYAIDRSAYREASHFALSK